MSHNSALASLTAQYTDSENDDDQHSDDSDSTQNSSESQGVLVEQRPRSVTPSSGSSTLKTASAGDATNNASEPVKPATATRKKPVHRRLVSYIDDNAVSDGEGEDSDDTDDDGADDDTNGEGNRDASASRDISDNGANVTDRTTNNNQTADGGHNAASSGDHNPSGIGGRDRATEYGFSLPPEPKGRCPPELQDKISNMYAKMRAGMDMNRLIQDRKEFRNPSIYEKLIQFCDINELGTNYPPEIYDPLQWGKESFYEELATAQKLETERRERERKDGLKHQLVVEAARKAEEEAKRRKSKWDQPAPGVVVVTGGTSGVVSAGAAAAATATALQVAKAAGAAAVAAAAAAAGLVQTNATGTKGTIISAFGSLPKKPKV